MGKILKFLGRQHVGPWKQTFFFCEGRKKCVWSASGGVRGPGAVLTGLPVSDWPDATSCRGRYESVSGSILCFGPSLSPKLMIFPRAGSAFVAGGHSRAFGRKLAPKRNRMKRRRKAQQLQKLEGAVSWNGHEGRTESNDRTSQNNNSPVRAVFLLSRHEIFPAICSHPVASTKKKKKIKEKFLFFLAPNVLFFKRGAGRRGFFFGEIRKCNHLGNKQLNEKWTFREPWN